MHGTYRVRKALVMYAAEVDKFRKKSMPRAPIPTISILRRFLNQFEESLAPLSLAEKWDNVGFLIESPRSEQHSSIRALTCIDLTSDVVAEAIQKECNMILTYHPIFFRAVQSLSLKSNLAALRCLDAGISVFSPHTALDSVEGGMNDFLCDFFKTFQVSRSAIRVDEATKANVGRIVQFSSPVLLSELLDHVKSSLNIPTVRFACATDPQDTPVLSLGVCVGSGSSVLSGCDADVYLTGEMSHHEILACQAAGKIVILLDHSSSERPFLSELARRVTALECVSEVIVSEADIEPIRSV